MQKKEKEITNIEEIGSILKKAMACRIALVDNDEPYIVPVCFGYERNTLYFHSALEGRKIELIKKNNKVCFEIDTDLEFVRYVDTEQNPCHCQMKYRSVIGTGRAYFVENSEEKTRALKLLMKQYTKGKFSFPKKTLACTLVVKINISSVTGKKSGY